MTDRERLEALIRQLRESQWASRPQLERWQLRHLARLADHFTRTSPAFAGRLAGAGLVPSDLEHPAGFCRLPVLTRRDIQAAGNALYSCEVPAGHGEVGDARSSGSTGEPVTVRRTGVTNLFWRAMAIRDYEWHRQDTNGRVCAIRADASSYARHDSWGPPASILGPTGPALVLPIATDVKQLYRWLGEFDPDVLVVYPSTLDALIDQAVDHRRRLPRLRLIRTIGETLPPATRAAAAAAFDARVADCYSSQEVGYIALECPESGLYHVVSESLMAEVIDDEGRSCSPGETGRVVVTDLHNFATPLIRYELGDIAEVAPACQCGRGLPTWRRILGRGRNLIVMPDGSRHWPVAGFNRCRHLAPVAQYQLVQRNRHEIEARLVVDRPLSPAEEAALRTHFHACIGYPFTLTFNYYAQRIPRSPSGKYEEFICEIAGASIAGAPRAAGGAADV